MSKMMIVHSEQEIELKKKSALRTAIIVAISTGKFGDCKQKLSYDQRFPQINICHFFHDVNLDMLQPYMLSMFMYRWYFGCATTPTVLYWSFFLELGICSISAILESYICFRNFYTLKK